jgi:glycerophosphoryl diester phosphodiesterase
LNLSDNIKPVMQNEVVVHFKSRLCPHRGIGKENTMQSIVAGISSMPFMVEFDVQLHSGTLYLGHPPQLNQESTLQDALQQFLNKSAIPKIDLKLNPLTSQQSLDSLVAQLYRWGDGALVNIDGDLDAKGFMAAEDFLMRKTEKSTLLNVDLCRYKGVDAITIDQHINDLTRAPFSLSPNLEDDLAYAIKFALKHKIPQIHFWSFYNKKYSQEFLCQRMETVLSNGIEVYFDIKTTNIIN